MTKSKLPEPPKFPDPPPLPDTKELIEPLRKWLDYMKHDVHGDWDQTPQYVALKKLLSEYPYACEVLLWIGEVALAEKKYGPWPCLKRAAHPLCDELNESIDELKKLAENGGGHNDELRYQQARNRLLEEPEIAARVPASLKSVVSLRAFQEQINLLMGDCTDVQTKHYVIHDEFRDLSEWLGGGLVRGSPEWIAYETWLAKMHLGQTYNTMTRMRNIRDAVVARVPERVRQEHWEQFVEKEFSNEPFMAHALIIAGEAWNAVFSRDRLAMKEMLEEKKPSVKHKTSKRAPRR
jgi:hypothetical protein